ncbi:hypothetical protein [Paenibacillus sp. NEAU-GSW1]|uniref:hypothetical protein n=1 Tax=Paenibacillus sp. NEAU-GSW1 TaxID=2682486 RepID=UPI0012E262CF|nr:hypothetical protein [Paenibacillus sp. NEAU-GSW1]MUT68660.1 hypothetical protein [Paenibacillus sp. NEAU-GSW1]
MSNSSRTLKWVTGALELFLGIPILGGLIVMGLWYIPLGVMLILHIVTLVISSNENQSKYGSILGLITSLVAWIPIVGMIMHIISGILLMVSAATSKSKPSHHQIQPPTPNSF